MNIFKPVEYRKALHELKSINALGDEMKALTDDDLKAKTTEFKNRLENNETIDDIRVEVFAVIREAAERVLKKRPYDVQMIGGLILDYGSVAEMKTGEGKTITSIAPVYLNALQGKGVLISTVNEYLAERDAREMGEVYEWMGMSVGINKRDLPPSIKRKEYAKDVTYSVHSEIGFDYLKDNMVKEMEEKVQRGFNFALVDEVDSILIDEARTPLIISGGQKNTPKTYMAVDFFTKTLNKDDYDIDMESKGIQLNDNGINKANEFFKVDNIFSVQSSDLVHRIQNSLRANYVMARDVDYIVRDEEILIVDTFTGRVMEGRSYSEGLHQAIQAKEGVKVEPENQTIATITYQNLFRMFNKLSGMSGTAKTEEDEFIEIYNMRVHTVPTNKPIIRIDKPDLVFISASAKFKAIVEKIKEVHKTGQPMLIGTEEVSDSEKLSSMLTKAGLRHTVLNAKQNESEAEIIAKAGEFKSLTIATNMAGRGTDIKPSKESLAVGGLFVLGTSKAESRRIDNQLKGRTGRQGDVGESQYFLSLDDNLLSRFSNQDKLKKMFSGYGDNPINNKSINKALNRAQVKIEGFNFDSRKNVLQYDDVIRQQRDLIYAQRDLIISHEDLGDVIKRMMESVVDDIILRMSNFKRQDGSYDLEKMEISLNKVWFGISKTHMKASDVEGLTSDEMAVVVKEKLLSAFEELRTIIKDNVDEKFLYDIEKNILLNTFDQNWTLHIDHMQKLKSSTSLSSYAQKNPFQQYVSQGAELFHELLERISHNTVRGLMNNRVAIEVEKTEEKD